VLREEREEVQKLLRQLMVLRADLNEVAEALSRLQDETIKLYQKLDDKLDDS